MGILLLNEILQSYLFTESRLDFLKLFDHWFLKVYFNVNFLNQTANSQSVGYLILLRRMRLGEIHSIPSLLKNGVLGVEFCTSFTS